MLGLVNLQTSTLEVHRLVGGKKLHRVRQLCLPIPRTSGEPISSASFRLSQACLPMSSSRSRYLPFRPSPDACLVGLTAILQNPTTGTVKSYWLTIRRDCLCSDLERGRGPTPWEKWSRRAACCVEMERPSMMAPIPAGARWLVYSQPLVVREFGLLSRANQRATTAHPAGEDARKALQDVFASQLPCCDIVSLGESKYQSISADYEWVVGMNEEVRYRANRVPYALLDLSLRRRAMNFHRGYTTSISTTSFRFWTSSSLYARRISSYLSRRGGLTLAARYCKNLTAVIVQRSPHKDIPGATFRMNNFGVPRSMCQVKNPMTRCHNSASPLVLGIFHGSRVPGPSRNWLTSTDACRRDASADQDVEALYSTGTVLFPGKRRGHVERYGVAGVRRNLGRTARVLRRVLSQSVNSAPQYATATG